MSGPKKRVSIEEMVCFAMENDVHVSFNFRRKFANAIIQLMIMCFNFRSFKQLTVFYSRKTKNRVD